MLVSLLLGFSSLAAQGDHRPLRQGDKAYRAGDLDVAQENYREALEARNTAQGNYNLGNTAYRDENYEEAVKRFEEAARLSGDEAAKASAYHNLGNTYYQMGEFEKSVEAYKNALRLRDQDVETKYNLSKALGQIPPPPPPQPDQQQSDQPEQNEDQSEQEQQEQENQQQEGQEDQPQDAQEGQDQQQPKEPRPQQTPPGKMSREEAERELEIARRNEEETMEKMRAAQAQGCNSTKKW